MPSLLPETSWIPYTFVFELVIFTAVYCHRLERRNFFWLRLLGTLGTLCLIAFLWSLAPDEVWIAVLKYISDYLLLLGGAFLCFNIKVFGASFIATAGYSTQHFAFKMSQLLFAFLITIIEGFEDHIVAMQIIYVVVLFVCAVAAYFIFGRQIEKGTGRLIENRINIVFSAVLLTLVSVVSAFFEDRCDPIGQTMLYGAGSAYDMVACFALVMLLFRTVRQKQKDEDYEKAEALWNREKEMLQTSKENMEYLRILAHDLKHEVEGALASGQASDKLVELSERLDDFGKTLVTGNDTLDIVLTERKARMDKENIEFTCITDGKALGFVNSSDLYSLFVNLLDNAISAVSKPGIRQRTISLYIQQKMGLVFIHEENPCSGTVEFNDDGMPMTTDEDEDTHGLGTKSIELVANKYGGHATYQQNGATFSVDVVLDPAFVQNR